jgi:hypothetical protein
VKVKFKYCHLSEAKEKELLDNTVPCSDTFDNNSADAVDMGNIFPHDGTMNDDHGAVYIRTGGAMACKGCVARNVT